MNKYIIPEKNKLEIARIGRGIVRLALEKISIEDANNALKRIVGRKKWTTNYWCGFLFMLFFT